MVPLPGAPRSAVRPDLRSGAIPGGRPGGEEDPLPGVRHPLPRPRVSPRVGGSRRSRRNDPRGVQRGRRRGAAPGSRSSLGRHARGTVAARKRLADRRHDHRGGRRRRAPRRVAGGMPASRARSLRRGPDRAARLPAQGSRRARRHGRRPRIGRDRGARGDGPPRGKRDPGGTAPRDLRQREGVLRRTAPEPARRGHPRSRGESGARQSGRLRDARVRVAGIAVRCRPGIDPGGARRGGRPAGRIAGDRHGGAPERVGSLPPSHGRLDLPGGDPSHLGAPGKPERHVRTEATRPPRDDRPSRRDREGAGPPGAPEGARLLEPHAGHLRGARPAGQPGRGDPPLQPAVRGGDGDRRPGRAGKEDVGPADRGAGPRPPPRRHPRGRRRANPAPSGNLDRHRRTLRRGRSPGTMPRCTTGPGRSSPSS